MQLDFLARCRSRNSGTVIPSAGYAVFLPEPAAGVVTNKKALIRRIIIDIEAAAVLGSVLFRF